jgi:2-polyprenyl-6-methoxyphenol hydroxylase-like FAD-dependent oxidoreductase
VSIDTASQFTFDRILDAAPPAPADKRIETACVLGGSIGGLLAARVLSDVASHVVIIERDALEGASTASRPGAPHVDQLHLLLPAGAMWMERWLHGFTDHLMRAGAPVAGPVTTFNAIDGQRRLIPDRDYRTLCASRHLIESAVRASVLRLPNVRQVAGRATGLRYRDGLVTAVDYVANDQSSCLHSDFVVDAMGRSSRLSEWLGRDGFEPPRLERLAVPINYATGYFERNTGADDLDVLCSLATYSLGQAVDGVSIAAATAVEHDRWTVALIGHEPARPGQTLAQFRAASAKLPAIYRTAVAGRPTRDIVTYRQAESRRRHFTGPRRFPARLVSVGDAVASFNPIYGQGMSSAALHASCLALYFTGGADLEVPAEEFFALQEVVADAAWNVSAGGDAARRDAQTGAAVPDHIAHRRWVQQQVMRATLTDREIAGIFSDVSLMLRHPDALTEPQVVERAVAANTPRQSLPQP